MIFYHQDDGQSEATGSPTKQQHSHGSPVKTVLASLNRQRGDKGGPGASIKVR